VCGTWSYHVFSLFQAAFGKKGVIITHISIFITTFGTMTSYLVIIGDMVAPMIGLFMGGTNDAYCSQYAARQFPITLALFFVIPLSILRNIDSLRYTSILAVVSVLYLLVVVVYKSGQKIVEGDNDGIRAWNLCLFVVVFIIDIIIMMMITMVLLLYYFIIITIIIVGVHQMESSGACPTCLWWRRMLLPWICGRVLRGEVCGTSLYGLCV
jgi:hypothetical protein